MTGKRDILERDAETAPDSNVNNNLLNHCPSSLSYTDDGLNCLHGKQRPFLTILWCWLFALLVNDCRFPTAGYRWQVVFCRMKVGVIVG